MSEPTFAAVKTKLDLPPKFASKLNELTGWLFEVEQYCDVLGIVNSVDRVTLAMSRLQRCAFTWWRQLTTCGDEYKLGKLVWSDFEAELVSAFSNVDRELRLRCQLSSLS